MNEITTVGVDLAKEVIAVCGADRSGKTVFTRVFRREAFAAWAVRLPPSVFGLEACGAAHHWARWLTSHGHTPHLMAAEFVKPFRKSRAAKNDRNDAEAVLTAVRQPNMRFVAVKSVEQQAYLSWHRMRQGFSEERTALINRLRGLLGEFGVWRGRSAEVLTRALPLLEHDEALPLLVRRLLSEARPHLARLDEAIIACEVEIKNHIKGNEVAKRLTAINGVGPLTAAATLATVTDARDFKNGRQFAAWGPHPARSHHQARRHLSARLAHPGRTFGTAGSIDQGTLAAHPTASLDRATARARRLPQDLGGDRQQARADDLGDPGQGRRLRSRRLAALEPTRGPRRAA